MKRSPILADHNRETELIAGIGGARLLKWPDGKFEIRGGTEEEREQLKEWSEIFLDVSFASDGPSEHRERLLHY